MLIYPWVHGVDTQELQANSNTCNSNVNTCNSSSNNDNRSMSIATHLQLKRVPPFLWLFWRYSLEKPKNTCCLNFMAAVSLYFIFPTRALTWRMIRCRNSNSGFSSFSYREAAVGFARSSRWDGCGLGMIVVRTPDICPGCCVGLC